MNDYTYIGYNLRKHEIWLKVSKTETINFYIRRHNSNLYIYQSCPSLHICVSGHQIKVTIFFTSLNKIFKDKTKHFKWHQLFLSKESKFPKRMHYWQNQHNDIPTNVTKFTQIWCAMLFVTSSPAIMLQSVWSRVKIYRYARCIWETQ